jgi:hypothetical protein
VVNTSSTDREGYVGRLVAFVDMGKWTSSWNNDNTLLEIQHWQRQMPCGVQPEKVL